MPEDTGIDFAVDSAVTPDTPDVEISADAADDVQDVVQKVDKSKAKEKKSSEPLDFKWPEDGSDEETAEETIEDSDEPADDNSEATTEKPKRTAKDKPEKDSEPDDEDSEFDSDEYLLDPDEFVTDGDSKEVVEALERKLAEANKGITAKFSKLDREFKARERELTARSESLDQQETANKDFNDAIFEYIAGESDKSLEDFGVEDIIGVHPKGKEFLTGLKKSNEYIERLEAYVAGVEIRDAMSEMGYPVEATVAWFEKRPQANVKMLKLIKEGIAIPDALKAVGVPDRRKKARSLPKGDSSGSANGLGFKW